MLVPTAKSLAFACSSPPVKQHVACYQSIVLQLVCKLALLTPGTIPDSRAMSGSGADQLDGLPATVQAGPDVEPGSWDQYFDEQLDIRLQERGATFRWVPLAPLAVKGLQKEGMGIFKLCCDRLGFRLCDMLMSPACRSASPAASSIVIFKHPIFHPVVHRAKPSHCRLDLSRLPTGCTWQVPAAQCSSACTAAATPA